MSFKTWIKFSLVWIIALIVIIIAGAVVPTLNGQVGDLKSEIIKSLSINTLTPNPIASIKGDSAYDVLNFLLSYGSFQGIFSLNGFSLFKFWLIDLYIFVPIFTTIALGSSLFVILILVCQESPQWKLKTRLTIAKFLTKFALIGTYCFLFLGLILVSAADNSNFVTSQEKIWYDLGTTSGSIMWANGTEFQPNAFAIMSLVINQEGLQSFLTLAPGLIKTGGVLLIFLTPIFVILFIVSFIFQITTSLILSSSSRNQGSKFAEWINFNNISTSRELRKRLASNIGMIILFIGFVLVMIFPAFASTGIWGKANLIIIIVAILLILISFIPIYFMFYHLSRLQQFSYNLLMFIQMIIWLVIGMMWQIIMWTECRHYFQYHTIVPILMIFFFTNVLLVSFYLLVVRGYRK